MTNRQFNDFCPFWPEGFSGIVSRAMAENKFHQLHEHLDQTLAELKVENDPERRRFLLREMSRLLA
jgi:hypothetical protein